jgi:phosphatidylserine decarboxylase
MGGFRWADPQSRSAFAIAAPGYPLIFAAGFATLIFALLEIAGLALAGLAVTFFFCWFFRDPDRATPEAENAVISAADGKVVCVRPLESNPFGTGRCLNIGVFMNVFNVHVNRVPLDGTVAAIRYAPGRFYPADKDRAWRLNEHNAVIVRTKTGHEIAVVQVAGLVARRIICTVAQNQNMTAGQRFGMICFGSRVDLYLPENTEPAVRVGDKVKAGQSIMGYMQ